MPELKERLLKNRRLLLKAAAGAGACCVGLALVGAALGRTAGAQQQAEEKVYRVSVLEVTPTGNDVYLQYTGLVQPAATEQCAFGAVGTIRRIYVKEGDLVQKGQVLAEIDPDDAQRQAENLKGVAEQADQAVQTAQKARDSAQKDYDKACEEASGEDLTSAKTALAAAKENRDAKQAELEGYNAQAQEDRRRQEAARDAAAAADAAVSEKQAAAEAAQSALETAQQELAGLPEDGPEWSAAEKKVEEAAEAKTAADAALEKAKTDQAAASQAVIDATTALAASQGLAASAQTQLTALETELSARQAAYDALKSQGGDSAAASLQKQRLDTAENALSAAKSAQITARNNYESAQRAIQDCRLTAASDGYVVKVVGSEGGLATPLAPVVVLGSRAVIAQFGASQSDVRSLAVGQSALVTVEGQERVGQVKSIAVLPDETTRTYSVDVAIEGDAGDFYLGEMAGVKIAVGERTGTWLPLAVVLSDGEDYVYLAQNGRAVRRAVTLLDVSDDMVLVSGLENGGQVICEGMKTVRSGSAVSVG